MSWVTTYRVDRPRLHPQAGLLENLALHRRGCDLVRVGMPPGRTQ